MVEWETGTRNSIRTHSRRACGGGWTWFRGTDTEVEALKARPLRSRSEGDR